MKALFLLAQYLVPHHLLSQLVGVFARSTWRPWKNFLIRRFIRVYQVDMSQAIAGEAEAYPCFNDFFTRTLKDSARPIAADPGSIVSPADGVLSAIGDIRHDQLIQAKGRDYSLLELLGGSAARAEPFRDGKFATVYLSPSDYHRVHMPFAGTLREMVFIPGRLFSVNETTTHSVPRLFSRNERVVCLFDTVVGPMAVILVGAMIVASIDTVWAGTVRPGRQLQVTDYRQQPPVHIDKGMEMGKFSLGSTVIVLFPPGVMQWSEQAVTRWTVRMGLQMGALAEPTPARDQAS